MSNQPRGASITAGPQYSAEVESGADRDQLQVLLARKAFEEPAQYLRDLGFDPPIRSPKSRAARLESYIMREGLGILRHALYLSLIAGFLPWIIRTIGHFFAALYFYIRYGQPFLHHFMYSLDFDLWNGPSAAWMGVLAGLIISTVATRSAHRSAIFSSGFSRRRSLNKDLTKRATMLRPLVSAAIDSKLEFSTEPYIPEKPGPESNFHQAMYVYSELDSLEFMYENYRDGLLGGGKHFVRACLIFQSRCESRQFRLHVRQCLDRGRYSRREFVRGVNNIVSNHATWGFPEAMARKVEAENHDLAVI
jgi:hypothetical protein